VRGIAESSIAGARHPAASLTHGHRHRNVDAVTYETHPYTTVHAPEQVLGQVSDWSVRLHRSHGTFEQVKFPDVAQA
jgi:oligoribonuclease (3'-5' exoribonuclease)